MVCFFFFFVFLVCLLAKKTCFWRMIFNELVFMKLKFIDRARKGEDEASAVSASVNFFWKKNKSKWMQITFATERSRINGSLFGYQTNKWKNSHRLNFYFSFFQYFKKIINGYESMLRTCVWSWVQNVKSLILFQKLKLLNFWIL